MAQQASPMGMGQSEFLRNQLMAASSRVWTTSPSTFELYPISVLVCMVWRNPNHARTKHPN